MLAFNPITNEKKKSSNLLSLFQFSARDFNFHIIVDSFSLERKPTSTKNYPESHEQTS